MRTTRIARVLRSSALLFAVAACGGDKPADSSTSAADSAAPAASPTATDSTASGSPAAATTVANGETIYQRCVACHQANGAGLAGAFPPLAGSEWVNGPADRIIAIQLHGLQGPIEVKGATYNGMMMAYGTGVPMSDDEVAAVLTYVRSSWGNTGAAVLPADVARARAATASRTTPWTADELKALP